jgi:hypothetical protein
VAFVAIGTRHLGLAAFVPVAMLWTIWALCAAVLTFSFQQWEIRRRLLGESGASLRAAVVLAGGSVVVVAVVTLLLRRQLFESSSLAWPLTAAAIPIGSVAVGLTRGRWASIGRYDVVAGVVAGENLIRAALAGLNAVVGAAAPWYGIAMLAGFAVAMVQPRHPTTAAGATPADVSHAAVSSADVSSGDVSPPEVSPADDPVVAAAVAGADPGAGSAVLGGAAVAGLLAHTTLVIAPAVVAVRSGSGAEVSALFAFLALVRAPYQLAQGLVPLAADRWTQAAASGGTATLERARRGALLVGTVGAGLAAAGAALVGGVVADALFGAGDVLTRVELALAGAITMAAVASLSLTVQRLAEGRTRRVVLAWIGSVAGVATIGAVLGAGTPASVLVAVAATELAVLAVLGSGAVGPAVMSVAPVRRSTR